MNSAIQTLLSNNEILRKNFAALAESGQELALKWLQRPGKESGIVTAETDDGPVIIIDGQSQASRRSPGKEARQWLEKARRDSSFNAASSLLLFGFGSPHHVAELLNEPKPVTVFEPSAETALAALSSYDFSSALSGFGNAMSLLTPWHLADNCVDKIKSAALLIHQPAQRRAPAQLLNLRLALESGRTPDLAALSGQALRVMVIPPLSGGSEPVASSLAKAVKETGHHLHYLSWLPELKNMELAVHKAADRDEAARLGSRIFKTAFDQALACIESFRPDLILALAQAPLDALSLGRLREHSDAVFAFWLVEDFRYFTYAAGVVPAYDVTFHIQQGLIEPALRDWGASRTWYLPLAADPDIFHPAGQTSQAGTAFKAELSFMGAGYPNRRRLMEKLAVDYWPKKKYLTDSFKIFGSGWDGAATEVQKHLFENGRRVTVEECAEIYRSGTVNLNIHSSFTDEPIFNTQSCFVNPRTFEIAAAGGFQIVDQRPLLPPLFQAGDELAVANDYEHLTELLDYYLNHREEAALTGRAARRRVLAEHTYAHRFSQMLSLMNWLD